MATISSLLADHVSLRVRSVDRIFLAGYVPALQSDGLLVRFLNERAGGTIPSPALLGKTAALEGRSGVVMLGVAQEKAFAWRGWRDGGRDAHPHLGAAPLGGVMS